VYAVVLYASGFRLDQGIKAALAYLPTVLILIVLAFDLWIWRWPGVIRLSGRPRIDGTWHATLQPHLESHIPAGGNRGPISAAVIIEQTYWTVAVRLMTDESASVSTSASLRQDGDSREQRILTFTYHNLPKHQNRPRSQPHVGAANLVATGFNPRALRGAYWTDRFTVGDMDLTLATRKTDYGAMSDVPSPAATTIDKSSQ
jgi:hypothetical protein